MQYIHNPAPKTYGWADPVHNAYYRQLAAHNEEKARYWHAQYLAARKSLERRYAADNPGVDTCAAINE
jgi:hypothetical protein